MPWYCLSGWRFCQEFSCLIAFICRIIVTDKASVWSGLLVSAAAYWTCTEKQRFSFSDSWQLSRSFSERCHHCLLSARCYKYTLYLIHRVCVCVPAVAIVVGTQLLWGHFAGFLWVRWFLFFDFWRNTRWDNIYNL